jgi:hypothetical protein
LTGQSLNGTTSLPPIVNSCNVGTGTCLACSGECDQDTDCAGSLLCLQRNAGAPDVPGCKPVSSVSVSVDYCYDPDLSPSDISVMVDEVPCKVSRAKSSSEKIVCTTGKKNSVSIHGNQPGSQGIKNL